MNPTNPFCNLQGLDAAQLQALYGADPTMAVEMFQEYLNEFPNDAEDLANSFHSSDVQLFKTYLHKLKPGFTYVGLTDIATDVLELETACQRCTDLSGVRDQFQRLWVRLQTSRRTVAAALQSLQSPVA